MRVVLVDPSSPNLPDGAMALLQEAGWAVETAGDLDAAIKLANTDRCEAVVLPVNGGGPLAADPAFQRLMREVESRRLTAVVLSDADCTYTPENPALVDLIPGPVSPQQLHARLDSLGRYQAWIRRMDTELANMTRLGKQLNEHFNQVDQEMRLAGRLQRDFLPQVKAPIGPVRFSTIFRPASWVSGDIYDIFRVDEQHVAFYIADAVGHGMAASLLTMFIKKAITAKAIHDDSYDILSPSETMCGLNDALAAQTLPNCQFVTTAYCLLNIETLEMRYARGGHPYPLLASTAGTLSELKATGGLMGLFPDQEFPTGVVQLHPGEKVILYSDGLEVAYDPAREEDHKRAYYRQVFDEVAHLPAEKVVDEIEERIDSETGSLAPRDDVTVLVAEILPTD